MKKLNYINYFFFIGFNFGWRIAWFIVHTEIAGEKKYGINTTGVDNLKNLKRKGIDISLATFYMPAVYPLLEQVLNFIPTSNRKHLLDIGCGKGRALSVAASMKYQQLTGIDISERLCMEAEKNLQQVQQKHTNIQYQIIPTNAINFSIPNTVDCIFLFNPFHATILQPVVANIMQSLKDVPRKMYIIYINPLYKQVFLTEGFEEIFYKKEKEYLELSILCIKK